MIRLFEGEQHADLYKKYRRPTPIFVVQKVIGYLEENLPRPHGAAVDVGCGSGQSAICLAPYFERVFGFDASASQVDEARRAASLPGNVAFGVAPAETLPLEAGSVELVNGGSSFHWFDFDKFYAEVDRVLVGNGVVAASGHGHPKAVHPTKGAELNALMEDFFKDHLTRKLHPRARYALNDYRDLPLPYPEVVRIHDMPLDLELSVADALGIYQTWSPFQEEYAENPQKMATAFTEFQSAFLRTMDASAPPEETPMVIRYNYSLAMCRKPAAAQGQ